MLTVSKFPEAGSFVVAGFVFLRYICPAIVTPPSYGLLEKYFLIFFLFDFEFFLTNLPNLAFQREIVIEV